MHSARITGPIAYRTPDGQLLNIPAGPCLIEDMKDQRVEVIWGPNGQNSAALALVDIESATQQGHILLLD